MTCLRFIYALQMKMGFSAMSHFIQMFYEYYPLLKCPMVKVPEGFVLWVIFVRIHAISTLRDCIAQVPFVILHGKVLKGCYKSVVYFAKGCDLGQTPWKK